MRNRSNFRRKMLSRRSPPRIISLTGVIDGGSTPKLRPLNLKPNLGKELIEDPVPIVRPVILNSVRSRNEPKTALPPSTQTTVLKLPESDSIPRIPPPRKKISPNLKLHSKTITVGSNGLPIHSFNDGSFSQIPSISMKKRMTKQLVSDGLSLEPGQTHIIKLSPRGLPSDTGSEEDRPRICLDGNQAVRITFMRSLGTIIQDIDIPPKEMPIELSVPPSTTLISATGIGGAGQIPDFIKSGHSSVQSEMSTSNTTGVGFQNTSTLIQVGPTSYLCRGASLRVESSSGVEALGKRVIFDAMHALSGQKTVTLFAPSTVESFILIMSRGFEKEATPSVTFEGLDIVSEASKVEGASLDAYVWGVSKQNQQMNKPFCATVEVPDGCKIHSLVGLRGSATNWVDELKHRDWNNLVEEGPLTQLGHSTLVWKKAEILSKEYGVTEIPKKSGVKVEDKKKRKGRSRKGGKKK